MELKAVILTLLAAMLALLAACAGYYYAYKRHINRALSQPGKKLLRLAPPRVVLIALAGVFALSCLTLAVSALRDAGRLSNLGDIEADIGLPQGWEMESAMDERAAAVLCFDAERGEHSFYVYENVGGTPVLGVNAPVIIGHGCSSPLAIKSMILSTEQVIKAGLTARLKRAFEN